MENTVTPTDRQQQSGRLIVELKDGKLTAFPVAASDEEAERLLLELAKRIQNGN